MSQKQTRCPTMFERRSKGKRYVISRWRCPRNKALGMPLCSYCNKKAARSMSKKELAAYLAGASAAAYLKRTS